MLQLATIGILAYLIIGLQPLNNATPTIDAINSFMTANGLITSGS